MFNRSSSTFGLSIDVGTAEKMSISNLQTQTLDRPPMGGAATEVFGFLKKIEILILKFLDPPPRPDPTD